MYYDECLICQHGENQPSEETIGLHSHVSGAGGFSEASLTQRQPILKSPFVESHVPSTNNLSLLSILILFFLCVMRTCS
jgi:hypothetical protein